METSYNPAPSLIPFIEPKWKRTFRSTDVPPSTAASGKVSSELAGTTCPTCRTNQARYSCPRCGAPYCSAECYRIHDARGDTVVANSDRSEEENEEGRVVVGGGRCTEGFYQSRVAPVLRLEAKDNADAMGEILNRSHPSTVAQEVSGEVVMTDEELAELAEKVLRLQDDGEPSGESVAALRESLPLHVRTAFERAVEHGELTEAVVGEWHPWWIPQLVTTESSSGKHPSSPSRDVTDVGNAGKKQRKSKTLDDRILSIPPFRTLRITQTSHTLKYNVLELLYATSLALRLYHGIVNCLSSPQESSESLLSYSAVLLHDERYGTVPEVMASCVERSTLAVKRGECNADWTILGRDVSKLCGNGRLVSRALIESSDILKAGEKVRKCRGIINTRDAEEKQANVWRLARKKVEFYLSWTVSHWSSSDINCEGLAEEVRTWVRDWQLEHKEEDDMVLSTENDLKKRSVKEVVWTEEGATDDFRGKAGVEPLLEVHSTRMRREDTNMKSPGG